MSVRVFIRPGCTGMGSCARLAPAVFRQGADGQPDVLLDDAEDHREAVLRAARACPFVGVEIDGVPIDERFTDTPVVSVRNLTVDVIELRVRCRSLPFEPGQYVFLRMHDEQGEFFRTYSVVEAHQGVVALCIKLLPNGRAGAALTGIAPGTMLGLSRAAGLFKLLTKDRPKLFITGGTGVAPVLPMALAADTAQKVVVFGARTESDLFYLDELRALPNTKLVLVVQSPSSEWKGQTGLVTDIIAKSDISKFHEIYTCGSPGMVEAVRVAATAKEFPSERIFADSFAAAPIGKGAAASSATKSTSITANNPASKSVGVASAIQQRPETKGTARRFDLLTSLRQIHYFASVMVCALIMFFSATGFIANHTDWLLEGSQSVKNTDVRALPENAASSEADPLAVCKLLFPDARSVEVFAGEGHAAYVVSGPGDLLQHCEINLEKRQVMIQPLRPLPTGSVVTDDKNIIAMLLAQYGGELNEKSVESAPESLTFEVESVWRLDAFVVDRKRAVYLLARSNEPLAKVISDLHRGKHAGFIQKLIMDVASIALLIVAITGTVMGLQVVRRRRLTIGIISLSFLSLIFLLLHR
jgi:ferredoxin-NADP reductase/ferredoxin